MTGFQEIDHTADQAFRVTGCDMAAWPRRKNGLLHRCYLILSVTHITDMNVPTAQH